MTLEETQENQCLICKKWLTGKYHVRRHMTKVHGARKHKIDFYFGANEINYLFNFFFLR